MATPSQAHLRSLYRSFLRELPPRPILATPRSPLHEQVRTSFASQSSQSHAPKPASPEAKLRAEAATAEQFITYLRSQRMYATLLDRYNPGMNMDEEERIRLTARRVGMELPIEYKK